MIQNFKTLVIIPLNSEADYIVDFIDEIKNSHPQFDYIFLNNASVDRTEELLKLNNVSFITSIYKVEYFNLLKLGFDYARLNSYDIIIEFANISQVKISNINFLINRFSISDDDLIIGRREKKEKWYYFSSESILRITNSIVTQKVIYDLFSRTKIFSRKVLEFISDLDNYGLEPSEIAYLIRNKFKISNVSLELIKEVKNDKLKVRLKRSKQVLFYVIMILFYVPFKKRIIKNSKQKGNKWQQLQ